MVEANVSPGWLARDGVSSLTRCRSRGSTPARACVQAGLLIAHHPPFTIPLGYCLHRCLNSWLHFPAIGFIILTSHPLQQAYDLPRLCADLVQYALQVDRLGPLDGKTQCPVPNQLCERAQTTADTEGRCVVERLLEAEVVEENTGRRVDVREGVLGLQNKSAMI